jgi:hypothetical protein
MKKALACLSIIVIVFSVMQSNLARANPYSPVPTIGILYPHSASFTCYSNASVPIKIGVLLPATNDMGNYTPKISYCLDNKENITLTNITKGEQWAKENPMQPPMSFTASSTIYNLAEGNHTLGAYSSTPDGIILSDEVIFTVDSGYVIPKLTLLSPQNKTYTENQVQIIFTINAEYKNAHYMFDYDLASSHDVFITGNTTLTNLSEGKHKIMVFADFHDKYNRATPTGEGTSFYIDTNKPNSLVSDNQVTIIGLTILAIAILATITSLNRIRKKQE